MKLGKTQNRICLGLVVGALVAYFVYQVAYATNESAYRFGYSYGKDEWKCWLENGGCAMGNSVCTGTWSNAAKVVTNQTACIDGFINAWNKVCTHSIPGAFEGTVGTTYQKVICPDDKVNEGLPNNY